MKTVCCRLNVRRSRTDEGGPLSRCLNTKISPIDLTILSLSKSSSSHGRLIFLLPHALVVQFKFVPPLWAIAA